MTDDVVVVIGGDAFVGWTEIDLELSFETVSNKCTIQMSEKPTGGLPAHRGDELVVLIDGEPVITGNVNSVRVNSKWSEHKITITGTDRTQDLKRSGIGPKMDFEPPVTMQDVARRTIKNMGLEIGVIDEIGGPPFKRGEMVSGDIEQRGFDFLDGWAQKRQAVLNTDGKGNLKITRNLKKVGSVPLIHRVDGVGNNVLDSSYDLTEDGQFNSNAMSVQKSPNDRKFWESRAKGDPLASADEMANQYGHATDSTIRPQLRNFYRGQQPAEGKTPDDTAAWHTNINRARGFTYNADVQGFHQGLSPSLWWPGILVPVIDDDCGLNCLVFIKDVKMKKSWAGGSITSLSCTYADAYSTQPVLSGAAARAGRFGIGSVKPGSFEGVARSVLGIEL